jgi:imidazolonepropionase
LALPQKLKTGKQESREIRCGRTVNLLPGFVDAHTHLIHAASRAEMNQKIRGASYEEIARQGGDLNQ